MTLQEARIFLDMHEDTEFDDALDEVLFQFKVFFTSQTIIRATFQSKLAKLDKVIEAASLFNKTEMGTQQNPIFSLEISHNMLQLVQAYHQTKNTICLAIRSSRSAKELKSLVIQLLDIHADYCAQWPQMKTSQAPVLLSKAKDPMDVLEELKVLKAQNIETFTDLTNKEEILPLTVVIESQRLYLLHQKEIQWRMSSEN